MKQIEWILSLGLMLLALFAVNAYAQSSREEFKQMVEQLQKNPSDNALREKIIKLAQELKPAPAVPDEAERRMARGTAAVKGAKSTADYQEAAREFELATLAAPWYGDAYYNLGFVQDKAEQYEAALRSLKLAQLASPDAKEIKALIYEVEFRDEKSKSPATQEAKRKAEEERVFAALEGAKFDCPESIVEGLEREAQWFEISSGTLHIWRKTLWASSGSNFHVGKVYDTGLTDRPPLQRSGLTFTQAAANWRTTYVVGQDKITQVMEVNGDRQSPVICHRR